MEMKQDGVLVYPAIILLLSQSPLLSMGQEGKVHILGPKLEN